MYFLAERNKLWCSNSSRDKVSVRLAQSKIYCCQKKDRMLKLHHKWSKAKKELWFFCNSFVVDGRKEKLCKIYYKQHFNCRTLKHKKQTSFLWDKTQKTFWILLVWYSWTLVLVCVCQCDVMVEQYEEVIEDWYKGNQEEDLTMYLCDKHVLKGQDKGNTHTF